MTDTIAVLVGRLNTGWVICEQETDPVRRHELEDHWLRLLAQYVVAVDAQAIPAAPRVDSGREVA